MNQTILLVLVAMATLSLAGVFVARITLKDATTSATNVVGGMLSFLLWGAVAWGSTGYTVETFCCSKTTSAPALTWISIALAALSLLVMIFGTSALADFSDAEVAGWDGGEQ